MGNYFVDSLNILGFTSTQVEHLNNPGNLTFFINGHSNGCKKKLIDKLMQLFFYDFLHERLEMKLMVNEYLMWLEVQS